eukprot:UN28652
MTLQTIDSNRVELSLENGDTCGTISNRILRYQLTCDESVDPPILGNVEESPACDYTISIKGAAVCPGHGSSSSGDDGGGLSGGWIFIIILLITCVYCSAGAGYIYHKDNETRGKDLIPHYGFWAAIPGFCWIGTKVSYEVTKKQIGRLL